MKKALKYIGIILGGLLFLILCGALFIQFRGIPSYEVQVPEVTIEMDSTSIANGKRLTSMVCAGCHMSEDRTLSGRKLEDIPDMFGTTWSQNITRHPEHGIGSYSDGELVHLLRTGIKRDGNYAPLWMPAYPLMSDEDMHDIVAFLRSDDPMTAPTDMVQPKPKPSFFMKFLSNIAFKPLPYPEEEIVAPPKTDQVAYGQYVIDGMLSCFQCHSADFKTNNLLKPPLSEGYMAGGNLLQDLEGNLVPSANLTMHETGLKGWTRDEFAQASLYGKKPDGTSLSMAMPPHPQLDSVEIDAMWAYIQTIPPTENDVPRFGEEDSGGE